MTPLPATSLPVNVIMPSFEPVSVWIFQLDHLGIQTYSGVYWRFLNCGCTIYYSRIETNFEHRCTNVPSWNLWVHEHPLHPQFLSPTHFHTEEVVKLQKTNLLLFIPGQFIFEIFKPKFKCDGIEFIIAVFAPKDLSFLRNHCRLASFLQKFL